METEPRWRGPGSRARTRTLLLLALLVLTVAACDTSIDPPIDPSDGQVTSPTDVTGGADCTSDEDCIPSEHCVDGVCIPHGVCPRGCEAVCDALGHSDVRLRPLGAGHECTVADNRVCAIVDSDSEAAITSFSPCDERGSGCLLAVDPPGSFVFRCAPGVGRCTGTEACDGTEGDVLTVGCDNGRILGVGCSGVNIFPNLTEFPYCSPTRGCVSPRNGPCFGDLFVCEEGLRCSSATAGTCRVTPVDVSLYRVCRGQSDCAAGTICLLSDGNDTGFCAPTCTSANDCGPPPGMSSTCVPVPQSDHNLCLLTCADSGPCPRDMICVDDVDFCIPVR